MVSKAVENHTHIYEKFLRKLDRLEEGKCIRKFTEILLEHVPEGERTHLINNRSFDTQIKTIYAYFKAPREEAISVRVIKPVDHIYSTIETRCEDALFIVDTIGEAVHHQGYEIQHTFHPVLDVMRNDKGEVTDFKRPNLSKPVEKPYVRESFVHMEIDAIYDTDARQNLANHLADLLKKAHLVNRDFPIMCTCLDTALKSWIAYGIVKEESEESAFFNWLLEGNFIFLGYRKYSIFEEDAHVYVELAKGEGLGILRYDEDSSVYQKKALEEIAANLKHYYTNKKELITMTKALTKSPVHRHADMDYIGVKEFNQEGEIIAEHRFLGLLTSRAYTTSPRDIPIIRHKIEHVLKKSGLEAESYNYKALVNVLETYPRDELFQISVKDLYRISTGIVKLKERQQVRTFIRHSRHELLVTAMVFVPRDRMTSNLRKRIISLLSDLYNAQDVEFITTLGESRLARLFLKIRSHPPKIPHISDSDVEQEIIKATRNWTDELLQLLSQKFGNECGKNLYKTYEASFSTGYQETNKPLFALDDIDAFECMKKNKKDFFIHFYKEGVENRLKVYHKGTRLNLSDVMPAFEKMGLRITDETPTLIHKGVPEHIWIHDFGVSLGGYEKNIQDPAILKTLEKALPKAWMGYTDNDRLNTLILSAGLSMRHVLLIRAFVAYLRQIGLNYSKEYMRKTFVNNPEIAQHICALFDAKFTPELSADERTKTVRQHMRKILQHLSEVTALDEDIILTRTVDVINAMVRTNAFITEKECAPLAFKIKSADIPDMPKPTPLYEIFVYDRQVEGIHLRGGKVARGGLRWSDRPEDFRTEVLGLVKAQMTKNAVIVPVGSKGGFVIKNLPEGLERSALMESVKSCYTIFISNLLSVTDNYLKGDIIPPRQVVRYDENDPYLVVAADKGTASFSDTANKIARQADFWDGVTTGFWLGDAFASGGSNGYDHKKMGITARGAWECVKHHFKEKNINIQKEPFTVIAVGDMGGDVFGNGMLLSKHIKLLAAFNHMHIFVDPNPDPALSWKERERLFKNPQLTWAAYDKTQLSKGGDIFERSAKSIQVSKEAQTALGLAKTKMTPNELIHALLKAPVDLLWNGGIGTYVKSSTETHAQVGDRANDAVRVDATDVCARVIGEGGNLGVTQKGRIEYALKGGAINTDAIDNSAGVNSSDYEVNIKIFLSLLQEKGLLSEKERNPLLSKMTKEVAHLAMRANYLQSQTLSLAEDTSLAMLEPYAKTIRDLSKKGFLDRHVEFLPDEDTLEERRLNKQGLTRPEASILMAYAKMDLYNTLLESTLPDEPILEDVYLYPYFPETLTQKFKEIMPEHQLKREIIATEVTNNFINRMGITFLNRMMSETGQKECTVLRAYIIANQLFDTQNWYAKIETLDNKVPATIQDEMRASVKSLIEKTVDWILRHIDEKPLSIEPTVALYQKPVESILKDIQPFATERMINEAQKRTEYWQNYTVDNAFVSLLAWMPSYACALDIAQISLVTRRTIKTIIPTHFDVGERFFFADLHRIARGIPVRSNWDRVGILAIKDQLYGFQKDITLDVLTRETGSKPNVEKWISIKHGSIENYITFIQELDAETTPTHATLNVALSRIKSLIRQ